MTEELQNKVDALRLPFDRGFAEAPERTATDEEQVIAIGFADRLVALPLADLSGVYKDLALVPLLGASPDLLGIVGIRGHTIVVYSLASFLRIERDESSGPWVAVGAKDPSVGVTFSEFRGYLSIPRARMAPAPDGAAPYVRNVARIDGTLITVIDFSRLLTERNAAPQRGTMK